MRWLLLFLRIGLTTGVAFGLVTGLIQQSAGKGLIQGAIFGALMGLVLTATTAARTQGRAPELSNRHRLDVHLAQPPEAALDAVVATFGRIEARNVVRTAERVTARTGSGWFSWGESMEVSVRPDHDATIASITSRPRIRTTLADYGRNRENVERVALLLGGFPTAPES